MGPCVCKCVLCVQVYLCVCEGVPYMSGSWVHVSADVSMGACVSVCVHACVGVCISGCVGMCQWCAHVCLYSFVCAGVFECLCLCICVVPLGTHLSLQAQGQVNGAWLALKQLPVLKAPWPGGPWSGQLMWASAKGRRGAELAIGRSNVYLLPMRGKRGKALLSLSSSACE